MICIGHRGAAGLAPENTIKSIKKAVEVGVPYIEIDVYNVEQELIVFHDRTLERTTNGTGEVEKQSLAYLRSLDAGQGERIPILWEVLEELKGKVGLNIELKGARTADLVVNSIEGAVASGWSKDQFIVSSFDHRQLSRVRKLDSELKIGALFYGIPDNLTLQADRLGAYSAHLSIEYISEELVEDGKKRGLAVFVYTVNDLYDFQRACELKVDGIFSDFPDRILSWHQEYARR